MLAGLPEDDPSRQYLQTVLTYPEIAADRQAKLVKQLSGQDNAGKRAKSELVTGHLQLAASMACGYVGCGVPLADLIQEANEGLTQAANQFKLEEGIDFSTYASWWIRQSVTRAINSQTESARVGQHLVDTMTKLVDQMRVLAKELGRMPKEEEIAGAMGLDMDQLIELQGLVGTVVKVTPPQDAAAEADSPGGDDSDEDNDDDYDDAL